MAGTSRLCCFVEALLLLPLLLLLAQDVLLSDLLKLTGCQVEHNSRLVPGLAGAVDWVLPIRPVPLLVSAFCSVQRGVHSVIWSFSVMAML